jgi:hypothetical protein
MIAAAVAAAAVSAAASIESGRQQANAAKLEQKQYEDQADIARVQGEQQEAARRQQLADTLATQSAIRAGRGVELDSGTGTTLRESSTVAAARDIDTIKANSLNQQRSFGLNAAAAGERATGAMIAGIGGAASSLLSGASAYSSLSKPAPRVPA